MTQANSWSKLDNAAKIFPPTSTRKDTKVFRFICQLKEEIDEALLQKALDQTMERFPFYRSIIKKGFFWFYFEDSSLKPIVKEEAKPPCSAVYNGHQKQLLFEVTYYRCRINLEIYHAITDGTGALQFLRTLVLYYLKEKHGTDFEKDLAAMNFTPAKHQLMDGFAKYYKKVKLRPNSSKKAYQFKGLRLPENRLGVTEGIVPVKKLLSVSRDYNATITEFLTAVLVCSIRESMPRSLEDQPVVVSVPVNLRNYFPSESSANFFCVINIEYDFSRQSEQFEDVVKNIKEEFQSQLTTENLSAKINLLTSLETTMITKVIPLVLKIPILKFSNRLTDRGVTTALSNVGKMTMPKEAEKYIELFSVFTYSKKLQICTLSYGEKMALGVTSPFVNTEIQKHFFRKLSAMGIDVVINSNLYEFSGDEYK